jgi:transcriptional regulator with XRE-family HTH domain
LITSGQIRAGRALLKWTGADLAEKSGVAFSTIMRMETVDGVPNSTMKTIEAIKRAFEDAGIEFLGSPEEGAGVRWKTKK